MLPNGKTVEKKITFNFKDSFLFIPFSLSKAAESFSEEDYSRLKEYGEHWELLKGKQVFPYTTFKSVASMKRTGLIPKEEFGTGLYQAQVFEKEPQGTIERESISDSDYEHYKKVMKAFNCKTFGDYVSLYCSVDMALLAILFERLTNICMDGFGVDPSKSYTSAGFFWEAMLRKTGVRLELLTDPEKYAFLRVPLVEVSRLFLTVLRTQTTSTSQVTIRLNPLPILWSGIQFPLWFRNVGAITCWRL